MKLSSKSLTHDQPIPPEYAFGIPDPQTHMQFGRNRSPHLAWSDLPQGTRSLVLICHDPDVPSKADDVNQEGKVIPAHLPRVDFFHWVLVDIPTSPSELAEGAFSREVTQKGKSGPEAPMGLRHGLNDYTSFLAGNPDMAGDYYGYDGPCPPWNDSIVHHYHFTLYATDLERCPVDGRFSGQDVLQAIKGHVLAEARITGTYSLNPKVPA
ncbi:MAG: YbhB/YbcL family Raf kinase inhibitor-like protein [Ectothiorhodospiraceae bacterium]|nr:YbhB/YbcL family Raf kinase inhibitor-like protein [Ectothiorhodospiraceae bacterium]MCH8504788.1 YbhB/YbcL family Raf kinase inhibitor-like protein [Ectothiorhodospiraceae bacterium]